jgi:hypothetical protein
MMLALDQNDIVDCMRKRHAMRARTTSYQEHEVYDG